MAETPRTLHQNLIAIANPNFLIDSSSSQAIRAFQKAHGLPVTGLIDPGVLRSLKLGFPHVTNRQRCNGEFAIKPVCQRSGSVGRFVDELPILRTEKAFSEGSASFPRFIH